MPAQQCKNGKWRWGNGPCVHETRERAEKQGRAIHAQKQKK